MDSLNLDLHTRLGGSSSVQLFCQSNTTAVRGFLVRAQQPLLGSALFLLRESNTLLVSQPMSLLEFVQTFV